MVFIHGLTVQQQLSMAKKLTDRLCNHTVRGDGFLIEDRRVVSDLIESDEFKGVKIDLNPAAQNWGIGAFPVNDYSSRSKGGSLGRPQ